MSETMMTLLKTAGRIAVAALVKAAADAVIENMGGATSKKGQSRRRR